MKVASRASSTSLTAMALRSIIIASSHSKTKTPLSLPQKKMRKHQTAPHSTSSFAVGAQDPSLKMNGRSTKTGILQKTSRSRTDRKQGMHSSSLVRRTPTAPVPQILEEEVVEVVGARVKKDRCAWLSSEQVMPGAVHIHPDLLFVFTAMWPIS